MSSFAKVIDGVVVDIINADKEFINSGAVGDASLWVESFNDGTRKNPAMIGGTYDVENDAFIPKKQHATWILNTQTFTWEAPFPHPENDGFYYLWSDELNDWIKYNIPSTRMEIV